MTEIQPQHSRSYEKASCHRAMFPKLGHLMNPKHIHALQCEGYYTKRCMQALVEGMIINTNSGVCLETMSVFCRQCVCSTPQSCPTHCDPRLLCPWDSLGKNTGVGCHVLLQGIFPTQGWNLCLLRFLHQQADSLPLVPPCQGVTHITKCLFF